MENKITVFDLPPSDELTPHDLELIKEILRRFSAEDEEDEKEQ